MVLGEALGRRLCEFAREPQAVQLRLCRRRRPGLSEGSPLHLQRGGTLRFLQVQGLTNRRLPHLAPRAGGRRVVATAGGMRRRDGVAALPRAGGGVPGVSADAAVVMKDKSTLLAFRQHMRGVDKARGRE